MEVSHAREIRAPVGDPQAGLIKIDRFLVIRPGDAPPDFTARTLDGKEVKLSDLRGKVVLLDFWATWCAPCVAEMPNLKRALERYGKDGRFVILGISLDQGEEPVKRFVEKRAIPWPQVVGGPAEENRLAKLYNVTSIPATFLIGPDGKVAATDLRGAKLEEELRKLLTPASSEPGGRGPTD